MSLSHDPPNGGKKPIRPPLRLVHPSSPKPPPKGRKPPWFSHDESSRVRAALRHARVLFGGWAPCAAAMYLGKEAVIAVATGRKSVSPGVALRLARALGVPLESLTRAPTDASTCPACGARRTP